MGGLGKVQKFSGPCASLLGLVWRKATDQCFYWRISVSPSQMLEGYGVCGERMNTFRDWMGSCSGPPSLACRWPDSPISSHYPLVCMWVPVSPFYEDSGFVGIGPTLMASFPLASVFPFSLILPTPTFLARVVDSPGWLRTWYSKEWPWTPNTHASIS